MQIKFIFIREALHLALFCKWKFFELGNGLLDRLVVVIYKSMNVLLFDWLSKLKTKK